MFSIVWALVVSVCVVVLAVLVAYPCCCLLLRFLLLKILVIANLSCVCSYVHICVKRG